MDLKHMLYVVLGLVLLSSLGLSWVSGYNNRVQINVSSLYADFNNVAIPIILNDTILGAGACAEAVYCNDSLTTYLNDTPVPFYIDEYNATDNFRLFVNVSSLNRTENFSYYFYYDSANITRSPYYNGSRVFIQFDDFNGYNVGDRPSGRFGAINVADLNITKTYSTFGCFDDNCVINYGLGGASNGDILYGWSATRTNGVIEFRGSTATLGNIGIYFASNTCGGAFPCAYGGGVGSIYPITQAVQTWDHIIYVFNNSNGNITIENKSGSDSFNVGLSGAVGQIDYGYTAEKILIDNIYLRDLIEDPLQTYISAIENAPPFLILNYINPDFLNISSDCDNITMTINPHTSEYPILNCSLWLNDTLNYSENEPLNDSTIETYLNLANGSYAFYWDCYADALYNTTANMTLNVMCAYPWVNYSVCNLYMLPTDFTLSYCLSNSMLYHEKTYTMGGVNCNYSEVETCLYGCEGNKCNLSLEASRTNLFYLIILLFVAILIIVMIAKFYR